MGRWGEALGRRKKSHQDILYENNLFSIKMKIQNKISVDIPLANLSVQVHCHPVAPGYGLTQALR